MDVSGDRALPTVLVVDDDDDVLRAAKQSLGGAWIVRTARSLDAARTSIRKTQPDVVIVDLLLGAERGFVLIRELRLSHPPLPTVLLSGAFTIELVSRACWIGVTAFAEKPASFREIVRDLRSFSDDKKLSGEPRWTRALRAARTRAAGAALDDDVARSLADAERDFCRSFLEQALARNSWNVTRTAEDIGVSRWKLHKLLAELEIERD